MIFLGATALLDVLDTNSKVTKISFAGNSLTEAVIQLSKTVSLPRIGPLDSPSFSEGIVYFDHVNYEVSFNKHDRKLLQCCPGELFPVFSDISVHIFLIGINPF